MAKTKFNIITSTCVPLPLENVDTDQIIPARNPYSANRRHYNASHETGYHRKTSLHESLLSENVPE